MILETDRLMLRECTLGDVKYMVEGLSNYNTAINLTTPYPYTEKRCNKLKQTKFC